MAKIIILLILILFASLGLYSEETEYVDKQKKIYSVSLPPSKKEETGKGIQGLICGPEALKYICDNYKIDVTLKELSELSQINPDYGTSFYTLQQAAKKKGLKAIGRRVTDYSLLSKLHLPSIIQFGQKHFVVLKRWNKDKVEIVDEGKEIIFTREKFKKQFMGNVLEVWR